MYVGVDAGSYWLKVVITGKDGKLLWSYFEPHGGKPEKKIKEIEDRLLQAESIGITGALAHLIEIPGAVKEDEIQSAIKGAYRLAGKFSNLVYLGASSISLIKVNEKGELLDLRTNSVCAAGTGSFLDQQAERMGIDVKESEKLAGVENPPSIAARCAVFAKSDLIHRQQEGYSKEAMWCGLCKGLSLTISSTLLRGEKLHGRTVAIGGVALNSEVINYLKFRIPELEVAPEPHLAVAFGAALLAAEGITDNGTDFSTAEVQISYRRPPLQLKLSKIPDYSVHREWVDDLGNEVRIIRPLSDVEEVAIGIDIGSTSTKLALLTADGEVIVDVYRKTAGDPIGATKKIFQALEKLSETEGVQFKALACGTTGSGRKLIGQIVGADRIVNEITAHAKGALLLFGDDIETIFEIGGQDSKYIHMKHGRVDNVNMNYVCAAGTGSFVEEQANKLGFKVQEIGDIVMGIAPPQTSERCTVFMEQDVEKLLREGASREEAIAAVLYSVCVNYLTKVVGNRPVTGNRILFQGATARNKGLVAAFENLLGKEIVTSPFCHVTGSIGAAWLALEEVRKTGKTESSFRGWDIHRRKIEVRYSECDLCSNYCKITHAKIEGVDEEPSWGYMCGRDPDDTSRKHNPHYEPFEKRQALFFKTGLKKLSRPKPLKIIMPRALSTYALLPLWRAFFSELNIPLSLTPETTREIAEIGVEASSADTCYPVKVFLGHSAWAGDKDGYVFIPHIIQIAKSEYTVNSHFCPYVQAGPSLVKASESAREKVEGKLIAPVIDFAQPDRLNIKELHRWLAPFGFTYSQIKNAWKEGRAALEEFRAKCVEEGKKILREIERTGQKAVVVVGRFYNLYDSGVNLDIPKKLSELGFTVIPYEFLPFDERDVGEFFKNMFWYYGQRIISAAKFVKKHPNLFLLYLTNFSCGPDSFILSYVEEIMGRKPYLILELDEHGADAGYGTRIEAFADVVNEYVEEEEKEKSLIYVKETAQGTDFSNRKILIPNMHPSGAQLFAAAFRRYGFDAEVLPPETPEDFELGRAHLRGAECLPTHVTTGSILSYLKKTDIPPDRIAIFMPTSDGPCRFGQYSVIQRIILNRLGYEDVMILSPSGQNAYLGLPQELRKELWKAILMGDIIFKAYTKTAPREMEKGISRKTFEEVLKQASREFESGRDFRDIIEKSVRNFVSIEKEENNIPLVGIVGEIFVRCNPFSCDYLVDWVIEAGAEPWLAPVSEWIFYATHINLYKTKKYLDLKGHLSLVLRNSFLRKVEEEAYEAAGEYLADRHEPPIGEVVKEGEKYFPIDFTGEAIITVGRAIKFIHQGASAIVNASPFTCMPGTITTAVFRRVSSETGIPVINMFYDGSAGLNEKVAVFLKNLKRTLEEVQEKRLSA